MEHRYSHRGFTLIELLIVSAIIVIITGVVFVNQSTYNKTLILANTAYDIALSLQAAETYGMGGHSVGISPVGYGLHFANVSPNKTYLLFADTDPALSSGAGTLSTLCHHVSDTSALDAQPGNCFYTGSDTSVSTYTLGNGITINDFCAYSASGSGKSCASNGATTLDIVFARPNPTPLISVSGAYAASVGSACLSVTSPQGGVRSISIGASGEIAVKTTACP